jgi:hypothetical protein
MKPKSTTTHRLIVSDPHGLCTPSQLVAIQAIESSIAGLNQLCQPLAIDDRLRIDREQLVADSSEFGRLLDDLHWPCRVPAPAEFDALQAAARTPYGHDLAQQIRRLALSASR